MFAPGLAGCQVDPLTAVGRSRRGPWCCIRTTPAAAWAEIVRGLDNLHEVEAVFQGKRVVLRSQVLGHVHKALMAAGVALPPTLREKA